MSESTENTAPSMCDQVLDYAYDELEGDAKAAFEAHLAGCKKCQADLASMKRVRGAVKSVLPSVEPPANATGALHAQLIHAAAQRATAAPGGGKVIPFGRRVQKVVLSPAFLAAAMFVIVGGAAGTMWWQGKFDMPAKHAEATAPVEAPAPAATPVVTAMPSGATATAEPEKAEGDKAKAELADDELPTRKVVDKKGSKISGAYDDGVAAGNEGGENKVYLGGIGKDSKPVEVRRAAPAAHAAAAKETLAEKVPADLPTAKADAPAKKMAPAPEPPRPMPKSAMKTREADNAALDLDGVADNSNVKGRTNNVAPGGSGGGVLGGVATTGDSRSRRDQSVQPAPAAKPAGGKLAKREEKPAPAQAGPQGGTWNGQVSQLPAEPSSSAPAAPPPPVAQSIDGKVGAKSSTADQTWRGTTSTKQQQAQPSFASPSTAQQPATQGYMQNSRNYAADRKKALDYADSGRCTDAVKVFEEMQKARWSLTAKEQTAYKRCKARLEEATKQDKNFQNRMMQDAERVHEQNAAEESPKAAAPAPVMESESQSVKAPSKAKKKAAPAADDASTKSGF